MLLETEINKKIILCAGRSYLPKESHTTSSQFFTCCCLAISSPSAPRFCVPQCKILATPLSHRILDPPLSIHAVNSITPSRSSSDIQVRRTMTANLAAQRGRLDRYNSHQFNQSTDRQHCVQYILQWNDIEAQNIKRTITKTYIRYTVHKTQKYKIKA